jgi:type VI secretion system protein ImpK
LALIDSFYEFYKELLAVNEQLDAGKISSEDAHKRLVRKLRGEQARAERELGPDGSETFGDAMYAMAALADEMLLNPEKPHAEPWDPYLLERELFHSQRAGEKIFEDAEKMQNRGSAAAELARVYLAVLGLGFQGIFRPVGGSNDDIARAEGLKKEIKRCREKLYALASGSDADAMKLQSEIAPAAYESTIADAHAAQLPHIRPWIYAMVLLVLLYIGGSFLLWRQATADLAPRIDGINNSQVRGNTAP